MVRGISRLEQRDEVGVLSSILSVVDVPQCCAAPQLSPPESYYDITHFSWRGEVERSLKNPTLGGGLTLLCLQPPRKCRCRTEGTPDVLFYTFSIEFVSV